MLTLFAAEFSAIRSSRQNDDISATYLASSIACAAIDERQHILSLAVTGYAGIGKGTFSLQAAGPAPAPAPSPDSDSSPGSFIADYCCTIGNQSMTSGGVIALSIMATDPAGYVMHYSALAQGVTPGSVTLTVIGNVVLISASTSFSGTVQIVATVSDSRASATSAFSVTVGTGSIAAFECRTDGCTGIDRCQLRPEITRRQNCWSWPQRWTHILA